jgi:hypothetical protein
MGGLTISYDDHGHGLLVRHELSPHHHLVDELHPLLVPPLEPESTDLAAD